MLSQWAQYLIRWRKVRILQHLADKLGVSKERARQLEKRAVEKLRKMAMDFEMDDLLGAPMVVTRTRGHSSWRSLGSRSARRANDAQIGLNCLLSMPAAVIHSAAVSWWRVRMQSTHLTPFVSVYTIFVPSRTPFISRNAANSVFFTEGVEPSARNKITEASS